MTDKFITSVKPHKVYLILIKLCSLKLFMCLFLIHLLKLVKKEEDLLEIQEFLQLVTRISLVFIVVNHLFKGVHSDLTMLKDADVLSVKTIEDILLLTFLFMKVNKNYMDQIFLNTKIKISMMCAIAVRRGQPLLLKIVNKFPAP